MTSDNDANSLGNDASSRERLLDAAIEIAGREGLNAVTYRAVAARVGMAHGMVRHHFGTREQMLIEAFRRAAHQDSDEVKLAAHSIDEFVSQFVTTLNLSRERQLLQYDETVQAIRGNLPIDIVRGLNDRYISTVHRTLQNAGIEDPDGVLSALVFATLDGLVLQHFVYGDDARTERILAQLRDVLRLRAQ